MKLKRYLNTKIMLSSFVLLTLSILLFFYRFSYTNKKDSIIPNSECSAAQISGLEYMYKKDKRNKCAKSHYRISNNKVYIYSPENENTSILLAIADPTTFSCSDVVGGIFYKDKNHIYDLSGSILDVDNNTYNYFGGIYYSDNNHIYAWSKVIEDVDRDTFQVIDRYYAKDSKTVYYHDKKIDGSDPNTFEFLCVNSKSWINTAKDKNRYYLNGEVISKAEADKNLNNNRR